MDAIDREILNLIQDNAKLSTKEIGDRIGLSQSPTYDRIKKLEKSGFISGYYTLLNRFKIEKNLVVFCELSLSRHSASVMKEFENKIKKIPSVMECHHIAGSKDYLLKIVVKDMDAYQHILNEELAMIPNIGQLNSAFVINEVKNELKYEV